MPGRITAAAPMWQPWQGSAAAIAAVILVSSPFSGLAAGGGETIFTLPSYKIDNPQYWTIFAGMVFYGFLIDRIQYFSMKAVEHSRCSKMIVDRCITEFMVFGIVALEYNSVLWHSTCVSCW